MRFSLKRSSGATTLVFLHAKVILSEDGSIRQEEIDPYLTLTLPHFEVQKWGRGSETGFSKTRQSLSDIPKRPGMSQPFARWITAFPILPGLYSPDAICAQAIPCQFHYGADLE